MVKFQMIYLCCVMFALQVFSEEALADVQGKSDRVMAQCQVISSDLSMILKTFCTLQSPVAKLVARKVIFDWL